jgi:hypothetical protein
MWPLIHDARDRPLSEDERNELRRLYDVICDDMPEIPGRDDFNVKANAFCRLLHSCGVFESGVVQAADRVLECIDELRAMLSPDFTRPNS